MNQELYHEIEKYIHHIEWYSDFDIYFKFGYIIRDKNDKDIILCCGLIYYHYYMYLSVLDEL